MLRGLRLLIARRFPETMVRQLQDRGKSFDTNGPESRCGAEQPSGDYLSDCPTRSVAGLHAPARILADSSGEGIAAFSRRQAHFFIRVASGGNRIRPIHLQRLAQSVTQIVEQFFARLTL